MTSELKPKEKFVPVRCPHCRRRFTDAIPPYTLRAVCPRRDCRRTFVVAFVAPEK